MKSKYQDSYIITKKEKGKIVGYSQKYKYIKAVGESEGEVIKKIQEKIKNALK